MRRGGGEELSWKSFVSAARRAGRELPKEGLRKEFMKFMQQAEQIVGGDAGGGAARFLLEGMGRSSTDAELGALRSEVELAFGPADKAAWSTAIPLARELLEWYVRSVWRGVAWCGVGALCRGSGEL